MLFKCEGKRIFGVRLMTKKDKSTDNLHKIVEIEKPKGVSKQPMSITQRRSVPSIRSIVREQILTRIKEACLSPEDFANIRSSVRQRIVEVSPDDKEKGISGIETEKIKKLAEEFAKDVKILSDEIKKNDTEQETRADVE